MKPYKVKIVCKVNNDIRYTDDYSFESVTGIRCEENLIMINLDNGVYISIPKNTIISLSVSYIAELEVKTDEVVDSIFSQMD